MRTLIALAGAAALLAACGQADQGAGDPGEGPGQPVAVEGPSWTRISGDGEISLRLEDRGDLIAALTCRGDGSGLHAASDRFQPVTSEERFTVGVGDEAYTLVADLEAGREQGVQASGALSPDLLNRLIEGEAVAFNYGAQNLGPFPVLPQADAAAFARVCRESAN